MNVKFTVPACIVSIEISFTLLKGLRIHLDLCIFIDNRRCCLSTRGGVRTGKIPESPIIKTTLSEKKLLISSVRELETLQELTWSSATWTLARSTRCQERSFNFTLAPVRRAKSLSKTIAKTKVDKLGVSLARFEIMRRKEAGTRRYFTQGGNGGATKMARYREWEWATPGRRSSINLQICFNERAP